MAHIKIFDTTLRDGEQSPGVALNTKEKQEIARQLARLGVDVIEAGFPIASQGDFEAVKAIAEATDQESDRVTIAGLARANGADIERAARAVEKAKNPRIHTFIATSPIHMEKKLKIPPEKVVEKAIEAVTLARSFVDDVEFSAEDAGRSDWDFLVHIFTETVKAGATTINIPDTVGYLMPWEYGEMVKYIHDHLPNVENITLSTHCHDDLGCAVINSLAGVKSGATQVECTINGIGERAGNASLEEVVMSLNTRKDFWEHTTSINTKEIYRTSRLVSSYTGMVVPPNKAIVGDNAFAHESGIHQDGVIKAIETYEIMSATIVGREAGVLVMGKHSGRNAFRSTLAKLGYGNLSDEQINALFKQFKDLCDIKQDVTHEDIRALVDAENTKVAETYALEHLQFLSGTNMTPTAAIRLKTPEGIVEEVGTGSGPVDASYTALKKLTPVPFKLEAYDLKAIGSGTDALGEVSIRVNSDGSVVHGRAISTDIVDASVKAYVNVLNKLAAGGGREIKNQPEKLSTSTNE